MIANVIPSRIHGFIDYVFSLDLVAGIVLARSPFVLGFAGRILWPHLTIGLMELSITMMTCPVAAARAVASASTAAPQSV